MQERPTPTARWDLIQLTGTQLGRFAERRETFASVEAWVEDPDADLPSCESRD